MSNIITHIINLFNTFSNYVIGWFECFKSSETFLLFYSTNHKYMVFIGLFVFFFLLVTITYMFLYNRLRLKYSILSYIFFVLFNAMFFCYIVGLKYINTFNMPIYVEDLSLFSKYRYLFLSISVMFAFLIWALRYFFLSFQKIWIAIKYPFVKEEIRKILYVWNRGFMGKGCIFLYKKFVYSFTFCLLYFSIHFFIFYILRVFTLCFLLNFTFFHGDLRLLIYSLPLLFFIWILSFLDYYFAIFREGTANSTCDFLEVRYEGSIEKMLFNRDIVECDTKDLSFTLTQKGLQHGFTLQDLNHLKRKWFDVSNLTLKFKKYENIVYYFGFVFFIFNCSCWFALAHLFFLQKNSNIVKATNFFWLILFRRSPILVTPTFKRMCLPREAYFIEEGSPMNEVKNKKAKSSAVSLGHLVAGYKCHTIAVSIHGKGQPPYNSVPLPLNNTNMQQKNNAKNYR